MELITAETICESVREWVRHYQVESDMVGGRCVFWVPGGRPLIVQFRKPGTQLTDKQTADINRLEGLKYLIMACDHAEDAKMVLAMGLRAAGVEVNYNVGG